MFLVRSVCLSVCLSVSRITRKLVNGFWRNFWRGRDQVIQFWLWSGSCFGSGSPKSEIQIPRIGGGLCCLSISSSLMMLLICLLIWTFLANFMLMIKKLYSCINTTLSREHLNYAINKLYEWSNVWQLQITVDKRFVCNIHPSNQKPNLDLYNYVLNTHVLEKVDVVRDLDVHVDCFLKFDHHISFIVHKAMTRARLILKCFLSEDRELLFKAYCVYVRPLLDIVLLFGHLTSSLWWLIWRVSNGS